MITADQVRDHLLALPRVHETTHVGRPAFAVDGTSFAGITGNGAQLTLRLDRTTAEAAVAQDPDAHERIFRGATFLGLSIRLATADPGRVRELLDASWHHMTSTTT